MANLRCDKCGVDLVSEELRDYPTQLLDHADVVLHNGVTRLSCREHPKASFVSIPDLPGLVKAAAVARVMHPRKLSGKDIRFMRKALGMPAKELADKLQVTPEAVSRWENSKSVIESASERLLRIFVGCVLSVEAPGVDFNAQYVATMKIEGIYNDARNAVRMEFCRGQIKLEREKPSHEGWMPEQRAANQ